MPRSLQIDPTAHLPAFLLRIYDAAEDFHGDPTIRGFTAGGFGRDLSMSVDDFIPKQITTGFSSHVRAQSPWISTSTSWLWVLFECERRFACHSHSKQPSNLRIAFISRTALDRSNIHYEDVSGPSYHPLARHAGEVLVHNNIPAKAVFETVSYLDIRASRLSSVAPFLSKRQALSFPELYRQDLPAAAVGPARGPSYRSVFESLWCRLPGEEPVDMARHMGHVARQHWVRLLAALAPTAVLTSSYQLFLPPAPFFHRSEYTALSKAFREGFYVPTALRMCETSGSGSGSSEDEDEGGSGSGTDHGDDSDSDDASFEIVPLAPPAVKALPPKHAPAPAPQVPPPAPAPVQPTVTKPIVLAAPAAAPVFVSAPPTPAPAPAPIASPLLILSPNPTLVLPPSKPAPVSPPVAAPAAAPTPTSKTTTTFFDAVRSWFPAWPWSTS